MYLLTSGTTGRPKIFEHSWRGLATQRSDRTRKDNNWILTYTAGTYAWYQMLTMLLFCDKQGLITSKSSQPEDIWSCARTSEATAISSTPSFWRYLLLRQARHELHDVRLQQISLGGEIVDQDILDELKSLYPRARISHLYASTEAGVGFIVNDGRAGFPTEWLDTRTPGRPLLSVQNDLLWIESPYAAADCSGLYCTGDVVSIRGDRAYILGRSDLGILNIGGQKIAAHAVEQAMLKHPNVAWCKVYAKKAPIVGALVAADVVLQNTTDSSGAKNWDRDLSAHCGSMGIADWATPRLWQYLETIPLKSNFKS
jgi:acyl-coenzyme A synthetase/AMP-(fatty) acid ligase